jgi:protein-S-isoprenylcysteine O-methyltransferase Ste14
MNAFRQIRAVVLLPGIVTLVIPGALVCLTGAVDVGWSLTPPLSLLPSLVGLLLICIGLILMLKTVSLLATAGQGTLAPWDPAQKLVVLGIYQYVRNPMISGVLSILLGEAIFLGSLPVLGWFAVALLLNLAYIPLFEEPDLARRFGEDYMLYKKNVPRWIPRLTPWKAPFDDQSPSGDHRWLQP